MKGLIDGDLLPYRIGFSTEGIPERLAKVRLYNYFRDITEGIMLSDYQTFLTSRDKSNFRYQIDPNYKGTRKAEKPEHYDYLVSLITDDKETFKSETFTGIEADDAIGIAASSFPNKAQFCILSLDKDLKQIPGWHYDFVNNRKYYVSEIQATRFFWKQLLQGDSADNIGGITGIGDKISSELMDCLDNELDMYRVVYYIYKETGSLDYFIQRGQLLKILKEPPGKLWLPPEVSEDELLNGVESLIKVDWRKSFERFSKKQNSKALPTNQSDSTLNTPVS